MRFRALALMLVGSWVHAQTFTTTDPPVNIPDNSGGVITACQNVVVPPGTGTIADVDVITEITHS